MNIYELTEQPPHKIHTVFIGDFLKKAVLDAYQNNENSVTFEDVTYQIFKKDEEFIEIREVL